MTRNSLLIGLMGDVMIGRLVDEHLAHHPKHSIWGDVLPLLKKNDLNLINLETTLTKSCARADKVFNFKADPKQVRCLTEGNIAAVNLANNHILDFSTPGLIETLQTLDRAGIQHVGAGNNEKEAKKPVILIRKGVRIGILGATDNEPDWKATVSQGGINFLKIKTIAPIEQEITSLREHCDILILSIHWGPNMVERPIKQFIDFAHDVIDCGVDIVHGHSAHLVQGVEVYKHGLILYDTADFIDDYYVDPILRNDRSFLFLVEVGKEGVVALSLLPVLISSFQVNLSRGKEFEETIARMQLLSKEFGCDLVLRKEPLPHLFFQIGEDFGDVTVEHIDEKDDN